MASKADMYLGILRDRATEAFCSTSHSKMYVQSHWTVNLKLPTVVLFVEFNTTMALAILAEQRDFVGAGVRESCR